MPLDMNPMAAGYGQNQMAGQSMPQNPMQGAGAPQKATSMPGAIAQMVNAMKGGHEAGMRGRAGQPGGPITLAGAGAPMAGTPDAVGLQSPDFPPALPPGPEGLPGPVATMPPMAGGGAVPFTAGTPGLPGIGEFVGPPGGGQSIMDIFGGGQGGASDPAMMGLFGGGLGMGGGLGGLFG